MPRLKVEWTAEHLAAFEELFLAGEHLQNIANELRVPFDRIVTIAATMSLEKKESRRRTIMLMARIAKRRPPVSHSVRREPTAASISDRDRRYDAPRTLTAEFCGDPRPGQSALDKRMVA